MTEEKVIKIFEESMLKKAVYFFGVIIALWFFVSLFSEIDFDLEPCKFLFLVVTVLFWSIGLVIFTKDVICKELKTIVTSDGVQIIEDDIKIVKWEDVEDIDVHYSGRYPFISKKVVLILKKECVPTNEQSKWALVRHYQYRVSIENSFLAASFTDLHEAINCAYHSYKLNN